MVVTAATDRSELAQRLGEARERTLLLVEQLDDGQLNAVYSPLLSPLAWDLGHIASFEELWLVQTVGGREPLRGDLGRLYDAIENPRAGRNELPILRGDELRAYMDEVRERALDVLEGVELAGAGDPLLRDGFVYEMLIAHEQQHNETMLQLLQMIDGYEPPLTAPPPGPPDPGGPEMVAVGGGTVAVGAPSDGFAYDNERPRHDVEVAPFLIDRLPVTNAGYESFVAATGAEPPLFWERDGDGWVSTTFGRAEALDPAAPVVHVDHRQATAYAEWAGKRLPTELEWELAATGADPGSANLDHDAFGCRAPGPEGRSACGAQGMFGDAWEWTSSSFAPYPGFRAFPYREYSEVFFARGYPVLRGGSWATRRDVIRPSFRNWDLPERRQIFAGLRCAEDA
ncbi:MAG: SUMF1/EgtB/PvdO family nonheme iron enzyme [Solirubrobacterales bacterium]